MLIKESVYVLRFSKSYQPARQKNTNRKKTQDNMGLNSLCNDICIVIHIYI